VIVTDNEFAKRAPRREGYRTSSIAKRQVVELVSSVKELWGRPVVDGHGEKESRRRTGPKLWKRGDSYPDPNSKNRVLTSQTIVRIAEKLIRQRLEDKYTTDDLQHGSAITQGEEKRSFRGDGKDTHDEADDRLQRTNCL